MKFLLTIAAVIAVAVAVPTQRGLVVPGPAGPAPAPEDSFVPIAIGPAVIDSFEPVAVGPAIINPVEGIAVGPAIINPVEGIAVGPAIIPFPLPDGGAVAEEPIVPGPAVVAPAPAASTSLVEIILNINQAAAESSPISVGPAIAPELIEIKPEPIHIVDSAPEPVQVVEVAPEPVQVVEVAPEPVQVVEVAPEPVQVVEVAPVPAEPVQIGVPVIPEAAVVLPEEGISVGPAIIPFPLPDGGAVAEEPIIPSPTVVAPAPAVVAPAASTPLVQIVLNVNQAAAESSPISVGPAVAPEHAEIKPEPIHIVESAPEPVQVVEVAPEPIQIVEVAPEPIQVVEVAPEPIQVVEVAPVPAEPVQIGVPVIPEAAVVLPEELN